VAHDPILSQEITNGHAARMRYSRFKKQMDGTAPVRRPRNPASPRKSKVEKKGKKIKKRDQSDDEAEKIKLEVGEVGINPAHSESERNTPEPGSATETSTQNSSFMSSSTGSMGLCLPTPRETPSFQGLSSGMGLGLQTKTPRQSHSPMLASSSLSPHSTPHMTPIIKHEPGLSSSSRMGIQRSGYPLTPVESQSQTQTPSPSFCGGGVGAGECDMNEFMTSFGYEGSFGNAGSFGSMGIGLSPGMGLGGMGLADPFVGSWQGTYGQGHGDDEDEEEDVPVKREERWDEGYRQD